MFRPKVVQRETRIITNMACVLSPNQLILRLMMPSSHKTALTMPLKALKRIEKINPTTAILNTDGRKKTTRKNLPPRRRALLTSTARMSAIGISTSILSPAMMNVFSSEFQ